MPVALSDDGCRVLEGLWFDPYTEMWFTRPSEGHRVVIDIDHLVPLKEAHDSGANAWERAKRIAYANDLTNPGHLIAMDASANRSKGDRDPAEWMPPNEDFHCAYVLAWVAVKRAWQLNMDQAEADAIGLVLARG